MQRLHAIEIDICMTQIGVMHRDDVEAQLQAEGADFLKAIAAQIEEALKRAATTDPLTELPNRAAFSAELERWLVRSRRLALGLIDLDGFKQVNDQHGHAAGDDPLKRFGELLKQVADPSDMMARLGGDEFAFLFEDRGAADRLAIRLGLTLSHPLDVGSCTLKVKASIGISLAEPDHSMRDVMVDAYARLYIDKRRRRAERNLGTAWAVPAALSPPGARLSV